MICAPPAPVELGGVYVTLQFAFPVVAVTRLQWSELRPEPATANCTDPPGVVAPDAAVSVTVTVHAEGEPAVTLAGAHTSAVDVACWAVAVNAISAKACGFPGKLDLSSPT